MIPSQKCMLALAAGAMLFMAACSGVKGGGGFGGGSSGSGGSGGSGGSTSFTIGGSVTGLSGTGLVLQNNGGDSLTITSNGPFTFATKVTGAYSVIVLTQPSNPDQTCTIIGGTGTAIANVTTVAVTCTTGTVTVGGQVTGLSGKGLVLQNNGKDNLTLNASGTFTFATPIAIGSAYSVTVLTQPTSPSQICTVANGSGTATGNVGNIVVTCSTGTLSIGGSVSGLAGTGMVLQDNGGDNLTITANGNFTFPTLLPSGATYTVTILTQPSGPAQTCTVTNGQGTATANVTDVQIVCPAVFHTIGGMVVGLYIPTGQATTLVLQDNNGDNLPITDNGAFTFVTPIAHGSTYDVTVFVGPGSQPQGCVAWNYQGTALTDITTVVIDCGHNDWTWMDGPKTGNSYGKASATPNCSPVDLDTPGGTKYPATWTDKSGNLWQFSGYGYSHLQSIPNQPSFFSELWEYTGTKNYFAGCGNYWFMVSADASVAGPEARWGAVTWTDQTTGNLWLFGGQDGATNFLNDLWEYNIGTQTWTYHSGGAGEPGVYGTKGTPAASNLPGGRWGAAFHQDSNGVLWMFGGFGCDSTGTNCSNGLLNDLWRFSGGEWTWVSGSNVMNQTGVYGTQGTAASSNVPGGRQASVCWSDTGGNFWMFGGYDLSPTGQPNAFNDLWMFDGTQWTWVAGANSVNQTAVYGTQGMAAPTNVPGARWSPASWSDIDVSGHTRLWIFGGQGFDATGNGSLADLWAFTLDPASPAANQWTWVKGPNSVSQAGTYHLPNNPVVWPYVLDNPGSRSGTGFWYAPDAFGNAQFFMFGGQGFDAGGTNGNMLLSDLWRYLPYPDRTNH